MNILTPYLEDLESRIDENVEEDLLNQWKAFLDDRLKTGFFSPHRQRTIPPTLKWPEVSINAGLENFEQMALQQLAAVSSSLADGNGNILNVRANYGVGILPSVFGAEVIVMDEKIATLPTSIPFGNGIEDIRRVLEKDVPDLRTGYGARCLDMGAYYAEIFSRYPKISRYVYIYHPDIQGPMDVCELLWGTDLFVDLYEEPDTVHALLKLITETYIQFLRAWERSVPPRRDYSAHWGFLHKGAIMLRDDSAMNLSPEMFETFIKPYDQKLLREFGGGAIHFCGRGEHFISKMASMDHLYQINLTQPEYNNMEHIFRETIDRGIGLLGLPAAAAKSAQRDLLGRVHVARGPMTQVPEPAKTGERNQ